MSYKLCGWILPFTKIEIKKYKYIKYCSHENIQYNEKYNLLTIPGISMECNDALIICSKFAKYDDHIAFYAPNIYETRECLKRIYFPLAVFEEYLVAMFSLPAIWIPLKLDELYIYNLDKKRITKFITKYTDTFSLRTIDRNIIVYSYINSDCQIMICEMDLPHYKRLIHLFADKKENIIQLDTNLAMFIKKSHDDILHNIKHLEPFYDVILQYIFDVKYSISVIFHND